MHVVLPITEETTQIAFTYSCCLIFESIRISFYFVIGFHHHELDQAILLFSGTPDVILGGSYGLIWLMKSYLMPDLALERPCIIRSRVAACWHCFVLFMQLFLFSSPIWVIFFLMLLGILTASSLCHGFFCSASYFGDSNIAVSDVQKYSTLNSRMETSLMVCLVYPKSELLGGSDDLRISQFDRYSTHWSLNPLVTLDSMDNSDICL